MMTGAGPNQRPDLDGPPSHFAPTKIYDPGSSCQVKVFSASRVLSATDGISRLFLQISVHRGNPESLNQRGYRCSETVLLIVCLRSQFGQCQLRMVVSQLPGLTIDGSDPILQV